MKILIAPNAMKNCLSATNVAAAIQRGINKVNTNIDTLCIPISDGGDGIAEVLAQSLEGQWVKQSVADPLGRTIQAKYFYSASQQLAIIELASAAGLALLAPDEYDVLHASTYGVGQMIESALVLGVSHIILGIGGSATNDAGMGIADALGIRFYDKNGHRLKSCAEDLAKVSSLDLSHLNPAMTRIKLEVICDVDNPLLGKRGAAAVYSPQKGASAKDLSLLENALENFAHVIKQFCNIDVRNIAGGGAAGGVGAGMKAFFNADLQRGADVVMRTLKVEEKIRDVDLVITAEGKLDQQSLHGKAPVSLASLARKYHKPVWIVAGQSEISSSETNALFEKILVLHNKSISIEQAIASAETLLENVIETEVAKLNLL